MYGIYFCEDPLALEGASEGGLRRLGYARAAPARASTARTQKSTFSAAHSHCASSSPTKPRMWRYPVRTVNPRGSKRAFAASRSRSRTTMIDFVGYRRSSRADRGPMSSRAST